MVFIRSLYLYSIQVCIFISFQNLYNTLEHKQKCCCWQQQEDVVGWLSAFDEIAAYILYEILLLVEAFAKYVGVLFGD